MKCALKLVDFESDINPWKRYAYKTLLGDRQQSALYR
jgi:hypothetical protein